MAPPQAKTNIPNIQKNDRSWLKCPDRREEEQRVNRFISVFLVYGEMGAAFVLLRFDINSCASCRKVNRKSSPARNVGRGQVSPNILRFVRATLCLDRPGVWTEIAFGVYYERLCLLSF
jgi:hypothetical protein